MDQKLIRNLVLTLVTLAILGCENNDSRVADVATAAAERQAQQSAEMAKAHANLTQGARELVESAGRSQESLIEIQQRLESQQAEIGRQRDQLENERQSIASQRHMEPIIATALAQVGLIIACLLPLIICWLILRSDANSDTNEAAAEVLIEEMTAEQPRVLPAPPSDAGVTGHLPPST